MATTIPDVLLFHLTFRCSALKAENDAVLQENGQIFGRMEQFYFLTLSTSAAVIGLA